MELWMKFYSSAGISTVLPRDPSTVLEAWGTLAFLRLARLISDFKLVVNWLSMSVAPPISFSSLVSELLKTIRDKGMSVRWIPRNCNSMVDVLAKSGIG
ncbi:hypothetical protein V6N12_055504 [Hibiscus sabdariffa]|uniref:RNase H type-1 domain-containing protein n=1 Tax=Hibiscus sabdariffa TaxID=183260 RepID=A0ABR2BVM9_9ROSI